VFENRVLRKIFGPKRAEVAGEWIRLINEKLYDLFSLRSIIRVIKSRVMRWIEHVASMGQKRGTFKVTMWRTDGNRQLGRTRRRWEDNIKMVFHEIVWGGMDWIDLAQDGDWWPAFVFAVMNLRVT
jgi:hypothetical protein